MLKGYLGIEDKDPDVIALEDEALRLRRSTPPARLASKPGPLPGGGLSYREIGAALGRSERWASLAVAAAERREHSQASGRGDLDFDGSILALRKFTSSELLDAGFNVSVVAQRQGHGPQVLTRHYSKSRAHRTSEPLSTSVASCTGRAKDQNPMRIQRSARLSPVSSVLFLVSCDGSPPTRALANSSDDHLLTGPPAHVAAATINVITDTQTLRVG